MTWSQIAGAVGAALLALSLFLVVRRHGWRHGLLCWLKSLARPVLIGAPVALVEACAGRAAAWCMVPIAIAAGWFGQSSLGILNFLLLQWFGIRLARRRWREVTVGVSGVQHRQSWFLLRWVWPLTGWWSEYRWIARRGGVR